MFPNLPSLCSFSKPEVKPRGCSFLVIGVPQFGHPVVPNPVNITSVLQQAGFKPPDMTEQQICKSWTKPSAGTLADRSITDPCYNISQSGAMDGHFLSPVGHWVRLEAAFGDNFVLQFQQPYLDNYYRLDSTMKTHRNNMEVVCFLWQPICYLFYATVSSLAMDSSMAVVSYLMMSVVHFKKVDVFKVFLLFRRMTTQKLSSRILSTLLRTVMARGEPKFSKFSS